MLPHLRAAEKGRQCRLRRIGGSCWTVDGVGGAARRWANSHGRRAKADRPPLRQVDRRNPMNGHRYLIVGFQGSGKTTFAAALWHLVDGKEVSAALVKGL